LRVIRVGIRVIGIVQGVGFRPTVFNHASRFGVVGFIYNDSLGVYIEAEGDETSVNDFSFTIKESPPPLAKIDELIITNLAPKQSEKDFIITFSKEGETNSALISPDVRICKECLNDITDSSNKRYRHLFTNCTNCGPRYSIVLSRPYDRKKTTMQKFEMCPECLLEYQDPSNRRFHAQPNCCNRCGPNVYVLNQPEIINPVAFIVEKIRSGKIVAVKGIGGFNIFCDPFLLESVKRLRLTKRRPSRSFALMAKDLEVVKKYCRVSEVEENGLASIEAPIVLLKKTDARLNHISPDNNYLGVMLPYSPIHTILMESFNLLIATSANYANGPIAINDFEIKKLLDDGVVDYVLSNDREIVNRCDDSIVQYVAGKRQVIRRSRGFVPRPIEVSNIGSGMVLGFGANLKNSFSIRKDNQVFISTHIGDLDDVRNYSFQESSIEEFKKSLEIFPESLIGDAHPAYQNLEKATAHCFHHHAHMLSAMGEHKLLGENVLGIICDGIGFGSDENFWGFEFLFVSKNGHRNFERIGHLDYFSLPGGDKAQTEIDRVGISLIAGSSANDDCLIYEEDRFRSISSVCDNKQFSYLTSSLGRLFDGVASILGIANRAEYEAQAAMMLQSLAESAYEYLNTVRTLSYGVEIKSEAPFIISYKNLVSEIVSDVRQGIRNEIISLKFHSWVVAAIISGIERICFDFDSVVFSGGCFQNRLLVELLIKKLDSKKIKYYFNQEVPINDAGISFGQTLM